LNGRGGCYFARIGFKRDGELRAADKLASNNRKPLACATLDLFELESLLLAPRQISAQAAGRLIAGAGAAQKSTGCHR
jgi:hypothetical protein